MATLNKDNFSSKYGIQQFYQRAIQQGFARDFQFRVLNLGNWITSDQILYLSSATMPGRTVNSIQVPYVGLNFQVPGTANYNSNSGWQVKFRCDETMNVRNALERWSRAIFDDRTTTGTTIPDNTPNNNITMVAIDNLGNARKEITLIGAWIQQVGDLSYNLAGNGALVEVTATIAYQFWEEGPIYPYKRPAQPYFNSGV